MESMIITRHPCDNELIYLSSIHINICKLRGKLNLDALCAVDELKNLVKSRNCGQIDIWTSVQKLRELDLRIIQNKNNTHENFIQKLPLLLQVFLSKNFFNCLIAFSLYFVHWFSSVFFNIIDNLVCEIMKNKMSLAQVLFTDLYKTEQISLFSALADNPLISKGLLLYFTKTGGGILSKIEDIFFILFSSSSFEARRQTLWNLFYSNSELRSLLESTFLPFQTSSVANFFYDAVSLLPISAQNSIHTATKKIVSYSLLAFRGGKLPSFDITRISIIIEEANYHIQLIYKALVFISLLFSLWVVLYTAVYLYCWYIASKRRKIVNKNN